MTTILTRALMTGAALAALAGAARAEDVTLTIESWRNDDLKIWQDKIIPAFESAHPGIKLNFAPSAPTEYNAALNAKMEGGVAGDIVACRAFDASLALFQKGHLASVNDLKGIDAFPEASRTAWSTDDGKTTYCVPVGSVIGGFIYNKATFDKLGLAPPQTEAEFFALLDKIKAAGEIPLSIGTADQWEAATMGFQNIGPNHWQGDPGRKALIAGTAKFTDAPYVAAWAELAKWKPYLADGYEAQSYPDSQNLFTLGRAAIYPAGSWEIPLFEAQAEFPLGAFPPPVAKAGDPCFISNHTDLGFGMNAHGKHPEAARAFLEWVASAEFATLYTNALPGFFTLSTHKVELKDPLAAQFQGWKDKCGGNIRLAHQILSRGKPNVDQAIWNVSAQVLNGSMTAEQAGAKVQETLDAWYKPPGK
ncbi:MAG: carbohydrate ABC transporter substrate-binding protein [Inquilinus limosus]|uniref:Probable sugar-binding periplasmic protein n=1 Tax=Inquilinus limosus TaxID=171674 RepID=A0A952FQN1_9PROT|nr:carbohydrate ABC transporter substrate-binding protein [Inquilinus limosus]